MASLSMTVSPNPVQPGEQVSVTYNVVIPEPPEPVPTSINIDGTAFVDGVELDVDQTLTVEPFPDEVATPTIVFSAPTAPGMTFTQTADPRIWVATAPLLSGTPITITSGNIVGITDSASVDLVTGPGNQSLFITDLVAPSDSVSTVLTGAGGGGPLTRSDVGPAAGTTFQTINGDYTLTDGEALSGKHILGSVFHNGNNSSITDCIVEGLVWPNSTTPGIANAKVGLIVTRCDLAGIYNAGGGRDFTVQDCYVADDVSSGRDYQPVQITDGNNATNPDGFTGLVFRRNYFYARPDLPRSGETDPHWELVHLGGVDGFVIEDCTWDIAPLNPGDGVTWQKITACLTMGPSFAGSLRGLCSGDLQGNWFYNGGSYQIYANLGNKPGGAASTINNNKFTTPAAPAAMTEPGVTFTAVGNTLDGAPYTLTPPP